MSDKEFEEWWNSPDLYKQATKYDLTNVAWHASREQTVKEVIEIIKHNIDKDYPTSEQVLEDVIFPDELLAEIKKRFEVKDEN